MRPLPFDLLLHRILQEWNGRQSILGIHKSFFHDRGAGHEMLSSRLFGHHLATPIGPAAGPHTQLAQNIVAAWLCGASFIELKTVQVLDHLEIPRPCIDMGDEGYNVEWSQELPLDQSAHEYVKAWALIHILHYEFGLSEHPVGTIFNASVGYNLEGIRSAAVTRFVRRMQDASEDLAAIRKILARRFPRFADIPIPTRITDNVTLSTMHGCPPEEIERIAAYLMEELRLHTTVKLNPTLLGREDIGSLLHDCLGYRDIQVPDAVFAHDLEYPKAVQLIRSLQMTAARCAATFGVKLSNTLPASNCRGILPGEEMYMSGRALYPLTINLFRKLADDFKGNLNVSFSGGADACNVSGILASGALPVTAATDLLKPGGYARLGQYLENIEADMRREGVENLADWRRDWFSHLDRAAAESLRNPRYQKRYLAQGLPKVKSGLGLFDCITAPCMEPCAVHQDVPAYAWYIARGEYDRALEAIMSRNPLPGITGYICTQLCREGCTRSAGNYDQPVGIRALKRFVVENGRIDLPLREGGRRRVAVIGSGPSGLAAAYFLTLSGVRVTIFESSDHAGGMIRLAPSFRIPTTVIEEDVGRIVRLGVDLRLSSPVDRKPEEFLREGFDAVYTAVGFQKNAILRTEGMQGPGIWSALDFLRCARTGIAMNPGPKVLIIGGGDTALDAARVAQRLTGTASTVVYRRTIEEMPAGEEDLNGAIEEGVIFIALASPVRVVRSNGSVVALECVRNKPGEMEADGRRRPVPIDGSGFQIPADSIIVAVGQGPDLEFLAGSSVRIKGDGTIGSGPDRRVDGAPGIYAGGDVVHGPDSVVAACGDGRLAAEAICRDLGVTFQSLPWSRGRVSEEEILTIRHARARKKDPVLPQRVAPELRRGFDLIETGLSEESARIEAARCLQCSVVCDKCVEVCPNRANLSYRISPRRFSIPVLVCRDGGLRQSRETAFAIEQSSQIIHLPDACNNCGNCITFCVHQGKPCQDKPRLYTRPEDFVRESDRAFIMKRTGSGWLMRRRERGSEATLEMREDEKLLHYENPALAAEFAPDGFRIRSMKLKRNFPGELCLVEPAEMLVIAQGIMDSLPFLLDRA